MGSAKFKKLVNTYKWDEAMEVCLLGAVREEVDVLDLNCHSA